jgi:hypothetical protein
VEVTTFGERQFKRGPARATASGFGLGDRDGETVTLFTSVPNQRITVTRR